MANETVIPSLLAHTHRGRQEQIGGISMQTFFPAFIPSIP